MSYLSKKYNFTTLEFEQWLIEVVDDGIGYLKVTNTGSSWLIYDHGRFHQKHMGTTKELYRTNRAAKEMFRKAMRKFQNIEHDGFRYYYDMGNWKRIKTPLVFN